MHRYVAAWLDEGGEDRSGSWGVACDCSWAREGSDLSTLREAAEEHAQEAADLAR